jgi:hypothetical protein
VQRRTPPREGRGEGRTSEEVWLGSQLMHSTFEEETEEEQRHKEAQGLMGIKFIVRSVLYGVGVLLVTIGNLLQYSDVLWILGAPGLAMIIAWFVLECQAVSSERWKTGHGGGIFFFGVAFATSLAAMARVSAGCLASSEDPAPQTEIVRCCGPWMLYAR